MLHIITSHPISHHVTTRIFRPLGMTSSTYSPEEAAKTGKLCDAFETIGGKLRRMPFWLDVEGGKMEVMNETQAAPGGVLSTIKDMVRWTSQRCVAAQLTFLCHRSPDGSTACCSKVNHQTIQKRPSYLPRRITRPQGDIRQIKVGLQTERPRLSMDWVG